MVHALRHRRRPGVLGAAVASMLLVLVACGDDGDDEVLDTTTTTESTTTTVGNTTTTVGNTTTTARTGGGTRLRADLSALNRSNASGTATVELMQDRVTVTVNARGTAPSLAHAQHIHIGGSNTCPPASAGNKTEPTDLIDTAEGQPSYGPVEVSLTTEGAVGADSALAVPRFPVADNSGNYTYSRTFALPAGTTMAEVRNGVVVVHGISSLFGDQARYDGAPRSSLDPSLPLETTIPALCGTLQPT